MKLTTTNLKLPSPRAWWELSTPAAAAISIFCILCIAFLVGKIHTPPQAQPTPALATPQSIIVIQRASAAPVVQPTAQVIYVYVTVVPVPTPEPEVVYVPAAPEAPIYQVTNEQPEQAAPTMEPPTPELAPQTAAILDRGAWAAAAATARAGR